MTPLEQSKEVAKLEEEKRKTDAEIQRLQPALVPEVESSGGGEDGDSVDAASAIYECQKTIALIGNLRDKILSIDNALRMVRKGCYGICEMCGERIDPARLEIVRQATLCVRCQAKAEARMRRGRPVVRVPLRIGKGDVETP